MTTFFFKSLRSSLLVTLALLGAAFGCESPKEIRGLSVPGEAYLSGHTPDKLKTYLVVSVYRGPEEGAERRCRLRHKIKVEVVKAVEVNAELTRFEIKHKACSGWVSHHHLSKTPLEPVGEVIDNE